MATAAQQRYDCIVIGAGHNGLVCATYLARSGRSVLVLEAAERVGGAAVTREFAPGFRVSACAHLLHLMPPQLMQELGLAARGLTLCAPRMPTTAVSSEAAPLPIDADDTSALPARSARDAAALRAYRQQLERFGSALHPLIESIPPRLTAEAWPDRMTLMGLAWQLRRLGRTDLRELLRVGAMCVWDLLEENFESDLLKGALGLDAVLGTNFGPRSPGTVFTLLYRMAAAGTGSAIAHPAGGLGALSEALARAAREAGAEIRTGCAVERILTAQDRAAGVVLGSGEEIQAGTVVSSADPKTTFLKLLGPEHLDTGFVRRIKHLRARGLAAKLHLALDRLPRFTGLDERALAGRLLLAPSLGYIERAFNHAKYGEFSAAPILECVLPSVSDPTLAPPGKHVLSAIVQYAPYELTGGWDGAARGRIVESVVNALEGCAPGLAASIEAVELLTPQDIEQQFRVSGGQWHHAELALDQFYMLRPVPGAAQYGAPIAGLYLCGAGCHPGGGVMGIAGRNAARQVAREAA